MIGDGFCIDGWLAIIAGKENSTRQCNHFVERFARGEGMAIAMLQAQTVERVALRKRFNSLGQRLCEIVFLHLVSILNIYNVVQS